MTKQRTAGVSPALTTKKSERDARGPNAGSHKLWHSRGYLPHCDVPGLIQSVTFRLADALPAAVLEGWKLEAGNDTEQHTKIDAFLDAGHGTCWLKQPEIADIVEDTLLHGDGTRYRLLAWCVMPNHVHVLFETHEGSPLSAILQGWKSFSAKAINQYLGRSGIVWMPDYFDRYIRDDHHLAAAITYIHTNPVKAGLVEHEWEWLHSSAHRTAGVPPALNYKKSERDARDPNAGSHKLWHSRGYLPHCDVPGLIQSVTFRLADALPAAVLEGWKLEAGNDTEQHTKIDAFLDAGHGACWLKQPEIADIVEDTLLHGDGTRYRLLAWCVMPNHVHVLFESHEGSPLSAILQGWKSFSAKAINQYLARSGAVWMPDYFDRYIRDDPHLAAAITYIHTNPVKAGLVEHEWEWLHSSAHRTAGVPPALTATASARDARGPSPTTP